MPNKIYFSPISARDAKRIHSLQASLFPAELTESLAEIEEILSNADAVFNCNHSFAVYDDKTMVGYVFAYIDSKSIYYNKQEEVLYIKEFGLLPGYEKYLRLMIFKLTYIWLTFAPRLAMEAHAVEEAKNKWLRLPIIQRQFEATLKTRQSDLNEKKSNNMTDYFILRWEVGLSGRIPKKYSLPSSGWEYQAGIIINLVTDANRLEALRTDWGRLQKESNAEGLISSLDYILLWWKYFGTWRDLFVIVIRRDDQVIGIAPLMREYDRDHESLRQKISVLGTSVLAAVPQLLFGDNEQLCISAVLAYLVDNDLGNTWDNLEFKKQASSILGAEFGKSLPANRYKVVQDHGESRVLHFGAHYLRFVEKSFVNKEAQAKVVELGSNYEFVSYSNSEDCKEAIETLSQMEEKNNNGSEIINQSPAHYFFYEYLVELLMSDKKCRWYVYFNDGELVASQLGYVENKRYFSLISLEDVRSQATIGDALLLSAIKDLMKEDISSVYFLEHRKSSSALKIKNEVDGIDVKVNLKKSIRDKLRSIFIH
ncbi:GNAT family N-acetyltransferase [Aurantivibrio infirmus]